MASKDLLAFARDLAQTVLHEADTEGAEQMRSEVFTRHVIDTLIEAGEIEDALPSRHATRGIQVDGYGVDDEDTLNLIATVYQGDVVPSRLTNTEAAAVFRRLEAFWRHCRDSDYHSRLEESSDAYDMALHIRQAAKGIRRVRLFLITDCESRATRLEQRTVDGIEVQQKIWDIGRLHRLESSGQTREPIEVDLVAQNGAPLPCLSVGAGREDYDAFLAVVPGDLLARVYEEYGARLLELNVRSFLQATGKVNRGIRDTLVEEPERFLAYNNGISATASAIDVVQLPGGGSGISRIRDLQIVNGGQTTASIHRAFRGKVDLSNVAVQAKITVIAPDRLDEIVPMISRFANSQNKVSEADLRSNDPFHVELESLSRTIWAPAAGDSLKETRWFYERARGQYQDAVNREGTPARQRAWKVSHPTRQRLSKTDVAKFENTWDQLPHEVSKGAQKNFTLFMTRLAERKVVVDIAYFERLVAKALLFKEAERLVRTEGYAGYRANLVTYALAKLSHETAQRIDLGAIWSKQELPGPVAAEIVRLSRLAWRVLVDEAPPGANVTEWAKQERCWRAMRDSEWSLAPSVQISLKAQGRGSGGSLAQQSASVADEKAALDAIRACMSVGADGWFALANWAKETANLQPWQRKLAFSLGRRISSGYEPTAKQAVQGAKILKDARERGYRAA